MHKRGVVSLLRWYFWEAKFKSNYELYIVIVGFLEHRILRILVILVHDLYNCLYLCLWYYYNCSFHQNNDML